MRGLALFVLVFSMIPSLHAQSDCPAIVNAALETVGDVCRATERNQACYGNIILIATPREEVADFQFTKVGDKADVSQIDSLQLSSLSIADESWGVALMKVQANLPDTVPGQNVTLLLSGNVEIHNEAAYYVTIPVRATTAANVRLRPSTDSTVLFSLEEGHRVFASGRLADNSWIRIKIKEGRHEVGWVSASLLTSNEEINTLAVVEPGAPVFGPMQAFTFQSGIGGSACAEAPDGIILQTPTGRAKINLRVNGVNVEFASTLYLQADAGDKLVVTVLEGAANLTVNTFSQVVPAGTYSTVPLDASGQAAGVPAYPEPYIREALLLLPLSVLPRTVPVAPALEDDEIAASIEQSEERLGISQITTTTTGSGQTASPSTSSQQPLGVGNLVYINMNGPNSCSPNVLPLGTEIDVVFGDNSWTTPGDRDNARNNEPKGITVNGQPLSVTHDDYTVDIYYGYNTRTRFTPPAPGTYTFVGTNPRVTVSCTITITG